jgi:hypothetical protein
MNNSQEQLLIVSQECLERWGPSSLWGKHPHMWALLASRASGPQLHMLASFLIAKSVPLNVMDPSGLMPLDIAVQDGDEQLIRILVRGGAKLGTTRGVQRLFSRALVYFNQEEAEIIWMAFSTQEKDAIWMKVYAMTATAYISSRPPVSEKFMALLREDWPRHHRACGSLQELVSHWGVVVQTAKPTRGISLLDLDAMVSWSFIGELSGDVFEKIESAIIRKTRSPLVTPLTHLLGMWRSRFDGDLLSNATPPRGEQRAIGRL